jgi:hypothetical protein
MRNVLLAWTNLERNEVTRAWRKLCSEIHNLYPSSNIVRAIKSRRMSWTGHTASKGGITAYKILAGKYEGKKPLERPGGRW